MVFDLFGSSLCSIEHPEKRLNIMALIGATRGLARLPVHAGSTGPSLRADDMIGAFHPKWIEVAEKPQASNKQD